MFTLSPIKAYLAAGVLIALAAFASYMFISKAAVEVKLASSEAKVTTLEADLKTVKDANEENLATIGALQNEKRLADEALKNLQADKARNAKTINTLSDVIASQKNNPANQVPLSPVLADLVAKIQEQRDARRGATK